MALLLVACSNPYYKFYRGENLGANSTNSCIYLGSIETADEIDQYLDKGYRVIGESGFSSSENDYSIQNMIRACNAVGGDAAVIVVPQYAGSENVMRTYYTYQPGETYTVQSTTRTSGDIYGRYDRVGSYNGTGQSETTIKSKGRYEAHPYMKTVDVYEYRAVYLKKVRSFDEDVVDEEVNPDRIVLYVAGWKISAKEIEYLMEIFYSYEGTKRYSKSEFRDFIIRNYICHLLVKKNFFSKTNLIKNYVPSNMEVDNVYNSVTQRRISMLENLLGLSREEIKEEIAVDLTIKNMLRQETDETQLRKKMNDLAEIHGVHYLDKLYVDREKFFCGSGESYNSRTNQCE